MTITTDRYCAEMIRRLQFVPLILFLQTMNVSACSEDDRRPGDTPQSATTIQVAEDAWDGLLRPTGLATGPDGRVYVADQGDMTIKVFSARGAPLDTLGRRGSGPGEMESIRSIVPMEDCLLVFDSQLARILRFPVAIGEVATVNDVRAEYVARLGFDRILLADYIGWSLPGVPGADHLPLVQVRSTEGELVAEIGGRRAARNPFVDRIVNFVLPAGTADGTGVWLAFLNDPTVRLVSVDGTDVRDVERTLPFPWKSIPEDYQPGAEMMVPPAKRPPPPFDPVSLDIATDSTGNAFVLTALSPVDADGVPDEVGVDRISRSSLSVRRISLPLPATKLAVSPSGSWIYALDESVGTIGVVGWE